MLFTGGAFSNIFDRFLRGKVIDYIGFQTRWPRLTRITYNLGDFAIFAGTVLVTAARFAGCVSQKLRSLLPAGADMSRIRLKRTPSPDQE